MIYFYCIDYNILEMGAILAIIANSLFYSAETEGLVS